MVENIRTLIDVCRRSGWDSMERRLVAYIDELEQELVSHRLPQILSGTAKCPLCGQEGPHVHTPLEQTIYRNGVKAGRAQNER